MKIIDPLEGAWVLPKSLRDWGEKCAPPIENPWLSQINFERSPVEVMSISRLLFPEFVVYQGGIFLKMQFTEISFSTWFEKLKDLSSVENILNHVHVYDVFGYADEATEEEFLQVAYLFQRAWKISLSTAFPDSEFEVTLNDTEQDYGPTLSFFKQR